MLLIHVLVEVLRVRLKWADAGVAYEAVLFVDGLRLQGLSIWSESFDDDHGCEVLHDVLVDDCEYGVPERSDDEVGLPVVHDWLDGAVVLDVGEDRQEAAE